MINNLLTSDFQVMYVEGLPITVGRAVVEKLITNASV